MTEELNKPKRGRPPKKEGEAKTSYTWSRKMKARLATQRQLSEKKRKAENRRYLFHHWLFMKQDAKPLDVFQVQITLLL